MRVRKTVDDSSGYIVGRFERKAVVRCSVEEDYPRSRENLVDLASHVRRRMSLAPACQDDAHISCHCRELDLRRLLRYDRTLPWKI